MPRNTPWSGYTTHMSSRKGDRHMQPTPLGTDRPMGPATTHTHPATTHTHDHYHVTHHHRGGPLGEWEHRTSWHTHEHNHNLLTHSHDYGNEDEEREHAKEAHDHDHAHPTQSPS
jgi:hypothetical protein